MITNEPGMAEHRARMNAVGRVCVRPVRAAIGDNPTTAWCGRDAVTVVNAVPLCAGHAPAIMAGEPRSYTPVIPASDEAITPKQASYIFHLLGQVSDGVRDAALPWVMGTALNRRTASDVITRLKTHVTDTSASTMTVERKTDALPLPYVPAGRYALHHGASGVDGGVWQFYRVDLPTDGQYAGRTFVTRQAGDDFHRMRRSERDQVLRDIADMGIRESMIAYGRQLGKCGACGRTLTDPDSIAAGIGPVCAGNMGW